MLTAEPVDLRGRRALAKSLEKEERHATDQLKQALKASNAAVDNLRAVGSELEDEAERVSERAKKDRARVDDVEAQCAYAKARRAELDRLSKRGAREALVAVLLQLIKVLLALRFMCSQGSRGLVGQLASLRQIFSGASLGRELVLGPPQSLRYPLREHS